MANTTPISNALNIALANHLGDTVTTGADDGATAATDGTDFSATHRNLILQQAYKELATRLITKFGAKGAGFACEGLVATQAITFASAGTSVNKDYIVPLDLLQTTNMFTVRSKAFLTQDKDPYTDYAFAVEASKLYGYIRTSGTLTLQSSGTSTLYYIKEDRLAKGTVLSIAIAVAGSGYTTPTVSIAAPTSGVTATATATQSGGIITAITVTNGGNGYASAPAVTISDGAGPGINATATATIDGVPGSAVVVNSLPDTTIDPMWFNFIIEYSAYRLAMIKASGEWIEKAPIYKASADQILAP